jgi:hypothetical protein
MREIMDPLAVAVLMLDPRAKIQSNKRPESSNGDMPVLLFRAIVQKLISFTLGQTIYCK